ncbi:unnamed protein product [Cyclocybe aegerita]|uniref:Peptidase S54 rhomboid domain-containing protein n=1 Tax=Cyclocybe aegerita TaxID=1973307 RepID=A0A8S0XM65_CYCAE|nr:unnamed protein product [Cyclocybe aegerita]
MVRDKPEILSGNQVVNGNRTFDAASATRSCFQLDHLPPPGLKASLLSTMQKLIFQAVFRSNPTINAFSFSRSYFSSIPTPAARGSTRPNLSTGFFSTHRAFHSSLLRLSLIQPPVHKPRSQATRLLWFHRWLSTSSRSSLRYHPPDSHPGQTQRRFLGFLDKIPQNVIFYGIIGLNSAVFFMWYMASQKYRLEGDPSAIYWMTNNFTDSWRNLASGRIWTPFTCCFSHKDWSHILMNGFTFFFMARPVLQLLGSRQFIFLYLGGGLISSFTSLVYAKLAGKYGYSSHGASGAIFSIVTLLACVAPTMTFQLYGIIPIPAWLVVSGLFSYDVYATVKNTAGTTDTMGHVGGVVAGIGYFLLKRFRVF